MTHQHNWLCSAKPTSDKDRTSQTGVSIGQDQTAHATLAENGKISMVVVHIM